MAEADCRGATDLFFPPNESTGRGCRKVNNERIALARAVCAACPVQSDCRAYALSQPDTLAGIWAGTSQRQRKRIRRQLLALGAMP
jgi:WhiB family redox-sensing transcriptional regulator